MDLHEAFRNSVNLVFMRVMRDIVNYTIAQGPQTKEELLDDPDEARARKAYLERFADQEGSVFLNRYIADYNGLTPDAGAGKTGRRMRIRARRRARFCSVRLQPEASFADYAAFMAAASPARTA